MKEEKPSAFSGFLRYFYGNFVVLILGFISVPLITRFMSTDEYGRAGMFTTAVTVIYIFAILGMDQTYIRYYYKEGVNRLTLMKQCLFPAVGIVAVLSVIYIFCAEYANQFLFGESSTDVTVLVISYTIISVFERFMFLDIRMQQNGKLYSNLNILSKALYIALVFGAFYLMGDNFRVVLYAMTISLGVVTAFITIRYVRIHSGSRTESENANPISQKELIRYGMPFVLVLLMEWLLSSCDRWAIRVWRNYDELGIYSSAMNIMSILLTFKATFVAFWSPVAMEKYERASDNGGKSQEECVSFFRQAFAVTQFLCILGAFGLIMFRDVIVLLLGAKYRGAVTIIPFLTLMPIFSIMFEITNQGIKFQKKNRYLNYASAAAIVCNLIGNYFLVPIWGGAGAAIATGITYIVYFAIGSFFSEKCYPVGYSYGRTVFYAALLMLYAGITTFCTGTLLTMGLGLAGILLVCLIDQKVLLLIWNYIIETINRLWKKK